MKNEFVVSGLMYIVLSTTLRPFQVFALSVEEEQTLNFKIRPHTIFELLTMYLGEGLQKVNEVRFL